jgi:hypothetical protein
VAAEPSRTYYREVLDIIRKLARLDGFASGWTVPASPAEAIEYAETAYKPPSRRYVLAVKLYRWAFTANPALADDLRAGHRYNAACLAVRAAVGQDEDMTEFGVDEWAFLTGVAMKWLREDLGRTAVVAKDPRLRQDMRNRLLHWKVDEDMAPVREPSRRAAMPPADRDAWQMFWAEVDAVLIRVGSDGAPPK